MKDTEVSDKTLSPCWDYMNTLPYMLMTYQFQKGILRASWMHLKKYMSSSLREQDQFDCTLDVIYYMTVMLFYDFPHKKCIEKMVQTYMTIFGTNTKL